GARPELPAQDPIVSLDQPGDRAARDVLDSRDRLRRGNPSLGEIVGHQVHGDLLLQRRPEIADHVGSLDRAATEAKPLRVLVRKRIAHRVAAEEDGYVSAAILHRVGEPDRGVVLLLDGGAVGAVDDAQVACHGSPHSVPMKRTPSEASQNFKASTGEPRVVPSTWFSTPRSSTQRPQLHQTSFTFLSAANATSDFTHSFGLG